MSQDLDLYLVVASELVLRPLLRASACDIPKSRQYHLVSAFRSLKQALSAEEKWLQTSMVAVVKNQEASDWVVTGKHLYYKRSLGGAVKTIVTWCLENSSVIICLSSRQCKDPKILLGPGIRWVYGCARTIWNQMAWVVGSWQWPS